MKLRNKKTGEVVEAFEGGPIDLYFYPNKYEGGNEFDRKTYQSLSELNDEWEDYVPKEPLIKDEKIRKAVRAWAEANVINSGHYHNTDIKFNATEHRLQWIQTSIEFNNIMGFDNLEDGETYTIDELCGEEEE